MLFAFSFPALLTGCVIGPDFRTPVAPAVERFHTGENRLVEEAISQQADSARAATAIVIT